MDNLNELPQGWKWIKLGDVCEIVSGSTPSTSVDEYWNGEISWITPTDLGKLDGFSIEKTERKITEKGFNSCPVYKIPVNSVVMSSRAPIGHLAINKIECCTNQGCKSFIPSSEIDTTFLFFALKINVNEFQQLGSGSTFAEISKTTLTNFEIALPELPEQQRLAKILTEKLAIVEQAKQKITAQLQAAQDLTSAYLREVFESEEAKEWELVKLGDVCEIQSGGTPSRNNEKFWSGSIPWYSSGELNNFYTIDSKEFITNEGLTKSNAKVFPKNYLLIGMYDTAAFKMSILDRDAAFNQAICGVKENEKVNFKFIYLYFSFMRDEYLKSRSGARQKNLSKSFIEETEIPNISTDKQQEIANYLTEKFKTVEQLKTTLQTQLESINQLPAALLKQAFNGKL